MSESDDSFFLLLSRWIGEGRVAMGKRRRVMWTLLALALTPRLVWTRRLGGGALVWKREGEEGSLLIC